MFNLSKLVNTIETDRRSKIVQKKKRRKRSAPEIIKAPKPETKDASTQTEKKQFAIDMECVTRALSVCDVACDTNEIQRNKEKKALMAFQKRIAEQKAKAKEMQLFLGKPKVVDEIEDE